MLVPPPELNESLTEPDIELVRYALPAEPLPVRWSVRMLKALSVNAPAASWQSTSHRVYVVPTAFVTSLQRVLLEPYATTCALALVDD